MPPLSALCVFCGSSPGRQSVYADVAEEVGRRLAVEHIRLVYGGGRVGLMGMLADACLRAGGHVIGVIPQSLVDKEVAHAGLTDLRVVQTMHERKALMADLSDGFVALPGGCGTFEELLEVTTWAQLGLHQKPCSVLNVAGYFDPLRAMLNRAVEERFLRPEHREMILVEDNFETLLRRLRSYAPPVVDKWLDRQES